MVSDPYKILGVSQNASKDEIKKAYRRKTKECHPDLHPDDPDATRKMSEVNEAYDMLMNPEKYASRRAQQQQQDAYRQYTQGGYQQQNHYQGQQGYQQGYYGAYNDSDDFEGFDFEDLFGFGGRRYYQYETHGPQPQPTDSTLIRQIISEINAHRFASALAMLSGVPSTNRNARWYYLSAIASKGNGSDIQALEHIKRACALEPNNQTYRALYMQYQQASQSYEESSQGFNTSSINPMYCATLCIAGLCCTGGCGFCRIC